MITIGLTGSIGMGKSTTAQMFRDLGIAVHDADATVHELYSGELVGAIAKVFPRAIVEGKVDRKILASHVLGDEAQMKLLESIVHPMVQEREQQFLQQAEKTKAAIAVLDIPLLFETGKHLKVDQIVVVSASPKVQRERVLARPDMSEEKFKSILDRQVPDAEKRKQADFVVLTDRGMEEARKQVEDIVKHLSRCDASS